MAESLGLVLPVEPEAAVGREAPPVQALLDAARAGDREAFGELVAMHERVVFRTALAALGCAEDAEDAAQEAFVVAWRKLATFRSRSTFRTWLLTIVWRKAIDRRRLRRLWWTRTTGTEAWRPGDVEDGDGMETLAGHEPSPERQAMSRELAERVRVEITRLSPKLRDTLLLAASGEHAYEEIAAMQRIPVGTVKWRVAEARRVVRRRLQP